MPSAASSWTHALLFLLPADKHRWRVGLGPMPAVVAPPPPVTEAEKAAVLKDARVQATSPLANAARAKDAAAVAAVAAQQKVPAKV